MNVGLFVKILKFDWTKGWIVLLLVGWYFLGHILVWFGRFGIKQARPNFVMLTVKALFFRIPKAKDNFNQNLLPLYKSLEEKFNYQELKLTWIQLFPVIKNFIFRNSSKSLITTYQNKYTLHRAIAIGSVFLFWFSLLLLIVPLILFDAEVPTRNIIFLSSLIFFSLVFIWNFSSSYLYHWEMFGNTIITEAYSLLYGPKNNDPS